LETTELQAVYVMWLRQMKRFIRSKSRIVSSVVQPLFFLVILGSGFSAARFSGLNIPYIDFLSPGIIAMAILFSSMFAGISILWDKQFGFLQEVLVAPVKRISIIIGRTLGGATTALIQGLLILLISIVIGIHISDLYGVILTLVFMVLIAFSAVGFGLVLASKMDDFQGFQLIMNLIIMPLLFLSSAFYPVNSAGTPEILSRIVLFNPLFYMVDGLRGSLIGSGNVFSPMFNLIIVSVICVIMMSLGSYFFSKSEA
jgi:ABC-2 type transport system permease protein